MPRGPATSVLRLLRRLGAEREAGPRADSLLLERFVLQRDETAFAALVEQHGPMVLGVCRRVLQDSHDADDAFQATFLVLIRKAGALAQPQGLSNWLYGVAYRTAVKARAQTARRRARHRPLADLPAPPAGEEWLWSDLRAALDEEISRLPARYRAPFVLCCLEGKTNEEAAECLGCPRGTVLSRLARARERLRSRLVKRGIASAAAALSTGLTADTLSAAVPPALVETTVQGALPFAVTGAAKSGSTEVITLAEGVLRAMFLRRLKIALAILVTVGLAAGAGLIGYGRLTAQPPANNQQDPAAKQGEARLAAQSAARLKELLKARFEAAEQEWSGLWQEVRAGKVLAFVDLLSASSQRLLVAQRELSDKKADQIAAWEAHVKRMRELEDFCKVRFEVAYIGAPSYRQAQYHRLDAEIGLERAKGQVPK